jgi:pyridinium-3,5-biscarboxylic acid mononucleotide sulfurtransferase
MKGAVLAYSGGVDSSLLLRAAADTMGSNLIAVTAISETYPPGELDPAKQYAATLKIRHLVLTTGELACDEFARNAPDRCYHCKRELFSKLRRIADSEGLSHILDGSNADDCQDYRPGRTAGRELGVRSPLAEAGLSKQEIRSLARHMNMPMWDKPSLACLSSRIPYGTRITLDLLRNVQAAEDVVRAAGIRQVRVRHHGDTARIEVAQDDLKRFTDAEVRQKVVAAFKELGYAYVCLDLEGYRTGSMNEILDRHR